MKFLRPIRSARIAQHGRPAWERERLCPIKRARRKGRRSLNTPRRPLPASRRNINNRLTGNRTIPRRNIRMRSHSRHIPGSRSTSRSILNIRPNTRSSISSRFMASHRMLLRHPLRKRPRRTRRHPHRLLHRPRRHQRRLLHRR